MPKGNTSFTSRALFLQTGFSRQPRRTIGSVRHCVRKKAAGKKGHIRRTVQDEEDRRTTGKVMTTDESRNVMSLLWKGLRDLFQRMALWLITLDTVPAHVCIVPDGHRRFSKATDTDLRKAYAIGKLNFFQISNWCFSAGAELVSAFAYSIRNLSRDPFEANAALGTAKDASNHIMENLYGIRKMGVRAECVGDLERLPQDVAASMARVEIATSSHTKKGLRMCAAYNTTNQMTNMALRLAKAVKAGVLRPEDITRELLEDYVQLTECCDVELLARTGGDQRFSDFLVLQCSYAYFHLARIKFPEFGFRHWVAIMLHFQLRWPHIQVVKERHGRLLDASKRRFSAEQAMRQQTFLRRLHAARTPYLERLAAADKAAMCH